MNSGSERSGIFGVACRDTASSFEKQESILNEMTELVKIFIVFPEMFTVFSWRNDWYHSLVNSFENDCVCIIAPICQKIFRLEALDQLR